MQQLHEDFQRLGLRPFHVSLGVQLDEKNRHSSKCIRCATCDGFPCLVYAKSDAQVLCVDPALAYPNVSLVTNALVKRLETDDSGREVTLVVVERHGETATFFGSIVVMWSPSIHRGAKLSSPTELTIIITSSATIIC